MAKQSFRKILIIFFPFSKTSSAVFPHTMMSNVLQVFRSFTLFQCSLDQSTANGGAVLPPLGQLISSVLDAPPSESPHSAAKGIAKKCISDISDGTPTWLPLTPVHSEVLACPAWQHLVVA